MRTVGWMLLMLAALAAGFSLGHAAMPFRLPLSSADAMHAAIVLLIAGALAEIGSRV
ncbi:MAG: hypothetical protein P4M09_29450 [Devosia sp.]|nr:hypothetical protein [Devosia sp.]